MSKLELRYSGGVRLEVTGYIPVGQGTIFVLVRTGNALTEGVAEIVRLSEPARCGGASWSITAGCTGGSATGRSWQG